MESILLTHAEVALGLAGFASVVAAFQRPLGPVQQHRFLTILLISLLQILACLVPAWLAQSYARGPELWRLASALYLGAGLIQALVLLYPLKALGRSGFITVNVTVTILVYVLAVTVFATHVANLFVISEPGFGLYYASLLAGLGTAFIAFADVATRAD